MTANGTHGINGLALHGQPATTGVAYKGSQVSAVAALRLAAEALRCILHVGRIDGDFVSAVMTLTWAETKRTLILETAVDAPAKAISSTLARR